MIQSTIRSSLPLEILLYINIRYSVVFYILALAIFIYKVSFFPYSLHVGISEGAIILLFGPIEFIRIHWARRGNLTEVIRLILLSLLLSLASASVCIYLTLFQAYIGVFEKFAVYAELAFLAAESILEIFAIISFYSK